ncbi:hypothetical protein SAMN00777080_4046 [Aquiflexum balticum DSM 16537]|uniref:DinB family protein n=1 Tax=Aquiflexum balticum DSM 16537 TaxID=758820 RepID=A0A1W2HA18_9BACT|nr:DinB family protein [Aquiflexum balticum]SMD45396.1 hypothetical protein SAMN00777080_4046 [Aquiflexum balticum DSM 16537]
MKNYCIQNLLQIKELICNMKVEDFSKKLEILSGSSIGQHLRHILELYQCLLDGAFENEVNYDNRKRNLRLETDPEFALTTIEEISEKIFNLDGDKYLNMLGAFSAHSEKKIAIKTSIYRELAYNLEHSIHHQALIKIGLSALGLSNLVDIDFGVAPATIKYKNSQKIQTPVSY